MRTLSTHRRHPLAGVVVLLLGLLAIGALYSALAPRAAQADSAADEEMVEAGRELFLVGCSSCHGVNGEGVEQQDGSQYGPSLIGVGAAAVDFQVGTGRMPLAQNSQQAPEKEVVYTDAEIEALAAFVASLGPGPAIPTEEMYTPTDLSADEIREGLDIYLTNCSACHNSVGAGGALGDGRYAPSLYDTEAKYIYEAMITGPQSMPLFNDALLTPEDKRLVIGYLETLEEEPSYGGNALGGFGPVTEGLAAWVVGMGGLVGIAVWIGASAVRARKK